VEAAQSMCGALEDILTELISGPRRADNNG
jgi:hypothetical protein